MNNDEHQTASLLAENFMRVVNREVDDIHAQIDDHHREVVRRNREVLKSIVECLLFCARQNIALRGHGIDEGNFMALIQFRAEHDEVLRNHLNTAPKNATYLSPQIQNELLQTCAQVLRLKIVADCNESGMFAFLADECTDVSTREQVSICVRFIQQGQLVKIREEFLGFVVAERTTGAALARTFMETLQNYGINREQMRAQSYDGAPNMAGIHNGVQAIVQREYQHAAYIYCRAHCLNICIVHGCKIPLIRNMMDTMQQIAFAFKYSAKRLAVYDEELDRNANARELMDCKTKLQALCETRWASRAKALTTFKSPIEAVVSSLEIVAQDGDAKARAYKASILKFDFLITLVACEHVFRLLAPLSEYLQTIDLDLVEACKEAKVIVDILSAERNDEMVWQALFENAVELAMSFEIEPSMPRRVGRQQHRDNVEADNPSEYWKRSMYLPLLDHLCAEMEEKLVLKKPAFTAHC